jgi:uncharacterized protein YcbX
MSVKPVVSNITIYPVKSLDGISLQKALITDGGCLLHDREYALFNSDGNFINGKSNPLVHSLRANFDLENGFIFLKKNSGQEWNRFHFIKDKNEIENYFSHHFGEKIFLKQEQTGRYMDIPDLAGLTVLSTASLKEINSCFNTISPAELRRRFRATIEIDGVPAFWEDRLFTSHGKGIEFNIGDITVFGISPRERCVVPTRDTINGVVTHAFPKIFSRHRYETIPEWSILNEYKHHYYLSVNCYVPSTEKNKWLNVGDEVKIIGEKTFY